MDLIQDVYDFFQSNYKTYCSGPLFKLFRVIDLKLAVFLRTMFKSSLTSWEELVDRYTTKTTPTANHSTLSGGSVSVSRRTSADKSNNLKRLSVGNKFSKRVNDAANNAADAVGGKTLSDGVPAREDGMIPASPTQKKLFLRNSEVLFPMETRTPLFQAELVINEGKMILEPSVEDIQGAFVQAVDKMVTLLTSYLSLRLYGPPLTRYLSLVTPLTHSFVPTPLLYLPLYCMHPHQVAAFRSILSLMTPSHFLSNPNPLLCTYPSTVCTTTRWLPFDPSSLSTRTL